MEPGLVSKKEAYKKIPDMCLAYYESKWEFCVHFKSHKNHEFDIQVDLERRPT